VASDILIAVKERLTGAIILVALIVLLVPALLTGPVRSPPHVLATASSAAAEQPQLRSYTIHLADDARAHAAAGPSGPEQPAPIGAAADAAASPAAPTAVPAGTPAPAAPASGAPSPATPAVAPPPPPGTSMSAQSGAWMVQLGSFASRANAERLAQQLRARGFQAGVSQGTRGRRLYRVQAGPAQTRAAAAQLAARLRAAGHAGTIVPK
jgi:cell division septation protein DedD